jgi:chemotaxis signal transduction protein
MIPTVDGSCCRSWCLFQSGEPFAVPIDAVAEVVSVGRLERFPVSPPCLIGLCTLRREVIPVISLNSRTRSGMTAVDTNPAVLVLASKQGRWGVMIPREGTMVFESGPEDSSVLSTSENTMSTSHVRRGETSYRIVELDTAWQRIRGAIERWYGSERMRGSSPDLLRNGSPDESEVDT